jgi:hypothetical protein
MLLVNQLRSRCVSLGMIGSPSFVSIEKVPPLLPLQTRHFPSLLWKHTFDHKPARGDFRGWTLRPQKSPPFMESGSSLYWVLRIPFLPD